MSQLSAALDVDTAKNIASGVSVGTVVIALLALRLVKNMVVRVVTIVALLAIGLASYSQRSNIVDCANKVKDNAGISATSCTFFGQEVEIPSVVSN